MTTRQRIILGIVLTIILIILTKAEIVLKAKIKTMEKDITNTNAVLTQIETAINMKNGEISYNKTCVICHGDKGQGMPPAIPPFKEGRAKQMTDKELFQKISDGVEGTSMLSWKSVYSETQIRDIITYIRELQK